MSYYPQLLNGMSVQGGFVPEPDYKTSIQDLDNGTRTAWSWYGSGLPGYPIGPLYKWKIPYNGLTEGERETVQAFFAACNGRYQTFTFLDPSGNLCPYSEDFTQAAWSKSAIAITTNGGLADPFGGTGASLLTSSGANGSLSTLVLPAGGAAGFALCGSVWAYSASATSLQLQFTDSTGTVLTSQTVAIPAASWRRLICPLTLASNNPVSFQIGGANTWGAGVGLQLFGAQVAASPGPGGYAKTPGNYGLHWNVRFDSDTLKWTKTKWNSNATTVLLRELNAGYGSSGYGVGDGE